jgi:hypothetical protein
VALENLKSVKTSEDYRPMIERMQGYMATGYAKAEEPESTADIVVGAIETPDPKVAYNTTADSAKSIADEQSMSEEDARAKRLVSGNST